MAGKRFTWVLALALILGVLTWWPASASADTISLSYRGQEGVSFTVNSNSVSASTAEFYSTSPFLGKDWIGYCVDPSQWFSSPLTVVSPTSWGGPAVGSTNWLEAAWLLENYAPGLGLLDGNSVNFGSSTVQNTIQAVQLAIWEVIVDPRASYSQSSLTAGSFRETSVASGSVLTMAGQYLSALSQAKATGGGTVSLSGSNTFVIGQSASNQDILLATRGAATPEPASLVLAASGLGVVIWRRRRREPRQA
jgi:hypothetical protein